MSQDPIGGRVQGVADIVFLLDVSGSMEPCLNALTNNIGVFFDQMTNPGPNEGPVVKDWRVKVCGYRDARTDGSMWWVETPFTSDAGQVKANLGSLEAKGGGDEPESLLDALWKVAKMPAANKGEAAGEAMWRYKSDAARCVIIFTDASCHMTTAIPEAAGAAFEDVVREVAASVLRLSFYCPEADCYQAISTMDQTEVEFIGSLSDAVAKMKEFSRDTNNFKKTMKQLAQSVRASSPVPEL